MNSLLSLSSKEEISNFCKIFGKEEPKFIPKNYVSVLENCHAYNSTYAENNDDGLSLAFPWKEIMGKEVFEENSKRYNQEVSELGSSLSEENVWYFENIFKENNAVFKYLKPVKVNVVKYKLLISKFQRENNLEMVKFLEESWMPDKFGFVEPPVYNLSNSITGRMTIKNRRANILTLSKEIRNSLFVSKFGPSGKLWYFDFVSLEPRTAILLQEIKKAKTLGQEELPMYLSSSCSNWLGSTPTCSTSANSIFPEDIYTWMLKKMKLSNEIDRATIKQIILPQIYGQNKQHVLELLKAKQISHPEEVVDMVSEEFGFEATRQTLFLNLQKNPRKAFDNFYGRTIHPDDMKPYKLFNYWIQSLSVDIALQGFGRILKKIEQTNGAKELMFPVFFIHDAMVMDIHNNLEHLIPKMLEYGGKQIKGFEKYQFYLNAQKLESKNNEY